jgi:hypothetical protein
VSAEPTRHLTPADLRDDALRIIRAAQELVQFCDLYEGVYADDLSEEIRLGFEFIAAAAKGAANRQKALHAWSAEFADEVNVTLARLEVSEANEGGDLLAPPPFGEATADTEHRQGQHWTAGPQEDREDDTADRHDEWVRDWNSTTDEGDDK